MKTIPALLMAVFVVPAYAESEATPELSGRVEHYYISYSLNADGSHVESYDWAKTVLKEPAVAAAKQTSITYSTSIQNAEVLQAYTRKPDGRHVDAPKSNFQLEVNSGKDKDAPVFSDMTTLTVVFPDVAVGDTVVFAYKLTQKQPIFPGHFSEMAVFPKSGAYDDVRIKLDWPSSLWVQYEGRGMLGGQVQEHDGRKSLEWTFQNKDPVKTKRWDYTVYDVEADPGFSFSTFKSYADIAKAYGERARPAVTERVQKLADDIVKDAKDPKEQARRLYDWVATTINYAGNCIGTGAVVPHGLDFILDNKMGDCKDHAALLQALLAAKNIPSTQALINSGRIYKLPKIPVVSMVNHVLNYIPSLDLYADSTSETIPFGMLPFSSADKPVLLVDGFKDGIKTPAAPPGTNKQSFKANIKVNPDGSITGDVDIDLKGMFAVEARDWLRGMPKDKEVDLVKNVFQKGGHIGTGKLDKEDPNALLDTYRYKVAFDMKEFIQLPGAGAFHIHQPFPTEAPISKFMGIVNAPEETVDSACTSGQSSEEYVYQFPKNMKILAVPDDMAVSNNFLSYQATYRLKGNVLKVKRVFDDRTPGNICSPELDRAYRKLATAVFQNLKTQVVYK